MPVHKPVAPVPPELKELIDSALRTSRSLRQVLEQDGLTDQVLNLNLPRLGELIQVYELWESLTEDAKEADLDPSVMFDILSMIRKKMEGKLATFQPYLDWLQGVADQFYDGSRLSGDTLRRMRGKIRRDHPAVSSTDANALPLPIAYELLVWDATSPVRSDATRSSKRKADRQIIDTLRSAGHRLTTTPLVAAIEKKYPQTFASESEIKKRLPELVRNKQLTNDQKAKPRGYGLPEWNGSLSS